MDDLFSQGSKDGCASFYRGIKRRRGDKDGFNSEEEGDSHNGRQDIHTYISVQGGLGVILCLSSRVSLLITDPGPMVDLEAAHSKRLAGPVSVRCL